MNIDEMLLMIDETLDEGVNIPLPGGKRMVDVDKIRDILDDIRENLPDEIAQAKNIVNDRAQILSSARAESEAIIKKAEARARTMVSEQEIVRAAKQRAAEIVGDAEKRARELTNSIGTYCDNMMRKTEEQMTSNARALKALRANLKKEAKIG